MLFPIVIIVCLILLNGIFAGAEIAVVSMRKSRLEELGEKGHRRAHAVRSLRNDPDRFFATVQIGITVVGASAAALGGADIAVRIAPALRRLGLGDSSGSVALGMVVAGISYLSLVLGELVPKSLGLRYSESYALLVGPPLLGLSRLARPLVWLLTASSNVVLRLFGDRTTFSEARMSAEELQHLVQHAARLGSVEPDVGEIASRALDLESVPLAAVMVPRGRMVCLDRHASKDEMIRMAAEAGHSRLPVKDGAVEQIVGYVLSQDVLAGAYGREDFELGSIVREAWFVPEMMRSLDALRGMQRRRLKLAIVVDERGTVAGLVTTEDLVEELVGEIVSEHEPRVELVQREADGTFTVGGSAPVRDVNRSTSLELPEDEAYATVAGLILSRTGHIPEVGETVALADGTHLTVTEANARRIKTVSIRPPGEATAPDAAEARAEEAPDGDVTPA
ncbi:MAG: HlyC/CorC family transporter [Deltaproteobacteria bacterium]|nr:HlyC/CorC family transporter [Deltaproteobacteria bacterium]